MMRRPHTTPGTTPDSGSNRPSRWVRDRLVLVLMGAALILRIGAALWLYTGADPDVGNDEAFYVDVAREPARLGIHPEWRARTRAYEVSSIGPVQPLVLAAVFALVPGDAGDIMAARIFHALFDTGTVLVVYLLARELFTREVALLAMALQAFDLRHVITAPALLTEPLFILLVALLLLLALRHRQDHRFGAWLWIGVLYGAATLLRPVLVLFPAALALAGWLAHRSIRPLLRQVGALTLGGMLLIVPWSVRTSIVLGSPTLISSTFSTHLWLTSREGGQQLGGDLLGTRDEEIRPPEPGEGGDIGSAEYAEAAVDNIFAAPLTFIGNMARLTAKTLAQPYGVQFFVPASEEGARAIVIGVLQGTHSPGDMLRIPGLFRRLLMIAWQGMSILLGPLGFIMAVRRGQRETWTLIGWVAYLWAVSIPLLIEPRYVYPSMFALAVGAAVALDAGVQRLHAQRVSPGH